MPTYRQISFSKLPCDFSATATYVGEIGNTASDYFGVGAEMPGAAILTPGQTYYMNIRNEEPGGGTSCPAGNCFAILNVNPASP